VECGKFFTIPLSWRFYRSVWECGADAIDNVRGDNADSAILSVSPFPLNHQILMEDALECNGAVESSINNDHAMAKHVDIP
jgi:hypothetical protein